LRRSAFEASFETAKAPVWGAFLPLLARFKTFGFEAHAAQPLESLGKGFQR
jgi:hypothetical protein